MTAPAISDVRFTAASPEHRGSGLLGYLAFVLDGQLAVDGVTLRRTQRGKLTLSYPERRDAGGNAHPIVRPLNDEARLALEAQVFDALGLDPDGWAR